VEDWVRSWEAGPSQELLVRASVEMEADYSLVAVGNIVGRLMIVPDQRCSAGNRSTWRVRW
jgi:hypothetical protein